MYQGAYIVKLLGKRDDAFVLPDNRWQRSQRGVIMCRECGILRREIFPEPVNVPLISLPRGTSYDIVFHGGVGVIHVRLLALLEPHIREFALGDCFGRTGALLKQYRTIYFRNVFRTHARPGSDRYYRYECPVCGRVGEGSNEPYVVRGELPEGDAFQDHISCLYLSESLARIFPWKEFTDVKPFLFPVREEV